MPVTPIPRVSRRRLLPLLLLLGCGCSYVDKEDFLRFVREQRAKDAQQDKLLEETAAKLACNDPYVQDFVRRCKEEGSKCDTAQIVTVVSKMRAYHHKVMRLPYTPGHDLAITEREQEELITLFKREHNILPSTKLLMVAIPSHLQKTPAPVATKIVKRPGTRPVEARLEPDVSTDVVTIVARNLRKSFVFAPYNLSEKLISGMEPQVPACEARSDELLRHFREIAANKLKPDELKVRAPWIDLIFFMVDCQ